MAVFTLATFQLNAQTLLFLNLGFRQAFLFLASQMWTHLLSFHLQSNSLPQRHFFSSPQLNSNLPLAAQPRSVEDSEVPVEELGGGQNGSEPGSSVPAQTVSWIQGN